MKLFRLLAFVAVLSLTTIACSSDDSPVIRKEVKDQKLLGANLTSIKGTFNYFHSANPIPIEFSEKQITIKMGDMMGSGQENDTYDIKNVYKNTLTSIIKVVTHNKSDNTFKAFFLTEITEKGLKFNMDNIYSFTTEEEAVNTAYPDPSATIAVDHVKGIFGWLKLEENAVIKISLPVSGKYTFSMPSGGVTHTYYYSFNNEKVNFNGAYDMTIIAHNTATNKILMVGEGENEKNFYVAQLKDITDNAVKVARKTFSETNKEVNKAAAEKEFAKEQELEANFTEYKKDLPTSSFQLPINGTYEFAAGGMSYTYDIKNNIINFNNSYDMEVLDFDKKTNNVLLKRIGEEKKNEFYVLKIRKITTTDVALKRTTFNDVDATVNEKEAKAFFSKEDPENESGFFTYTKK